MAEAEQNGAAGYLVALPVFEGPFDLLFHLIQREEVDIWEIPLGKITNQYLAYIQSMQQLEVELAGEFLVMAAALLQLKSRLLLPSLPARLTDKEETDLFFGSKEELVRCLLEYRKAKAIALELYKRQDGQQRVFLRSGSQQKIMLINHQKMIYPFAYDSLKQAVKNLRRRREKELKLPEPVPVPSYENLSFRDTLKRIMDRIKNVKKTILSFEDFIKKRRDKSEVVITFFALLELARRGQVRLSQYRPFSPIQVMQTGGENQADEPGGPPSSRK